MQRVDDIQQPRFTLNHDIMTSNEHEFWMGHKQLFTIRRADSRGSTISQLLPDELAIHGKYMASGQSTVKQFRFLERSRPVMRIKG